MTKRLTTLFLVCLVALALTSVDASADWPHWRGPSASGAAEGNPPSKWSETENIKWKVAIPGLGQSTPIIVDGKIFLLTAIPAGSAAQPAQPAQQPRQGGGRRGGGGGGFGGGGGGFGGFGGGGGGTALQEFAVLCLDQETGDTLWTKAVTEATPHEGHHGTGSFASYSPVTDGERLYVSFGSRGLYCLDFEGNVLWEKDLIDLQILASFGEGSSPALAGDAVIVVMDHEGDSKIAAYNKFDGELLWEKPRDEATSWATPVIAEVDGRLQVITNASNRVRAYDAENGDLIWECGGQTRNVIPTPIVDGDIVYCTSGFGGAALQAIQLGKTGDLTGSDAILWHVDRATPYVPSPLLFKGKIYVLNNTRPEIACYDAKTGEPVFTGQRINGLGNAVYASPVGAGGKVYVGDRDGTVVVLDGGMEYKVLETNKLEEGIDASPVVVDDILYLRTTSHLYAIAE